MVIGVLKERKIDEHRVALLPAHVRELSRLGHVLLVEKGAGTVAGFPDSEYAEATIVDRAEVYERSTLLLKVKCPLPDEVGFLRPGHTLFTYLHFDENIPPERILNIVATGATGIAFEWVESDGLFPLLQPMSELTGGIFAFRAMNLLLEHAGIVGASFGSNTPRPESVVVGCGHIGANAIRALLLAGFRVTLIDKHPETVDQRIAQYLHPSAWVELKQFVRVLHFDEERVIPSLQLLRGAVVEADLVICSAVRRPSFPKSACEYLIDRATVARMRPNRVLCDATACDGDFVETAVSSERLNDWYFEEGVVHYNCDHIPSLAANAASRLLAEAIIPYVNDLANGFVQAARSNAALCKGVMCHQGALTHAYSATKKGLPYSDLNSLLA